MNWKLIGIIGGCVVAVGVAGYGAYKFFTRKPEEKKAETPNTEAKANA